MESTYKALIYSDIPVEMYKALLDIKRGYPKLDSVAESFLLNDGKMLGESKNSSADFRELQDIDVKHLLDKVTSRTNELKHSEFLIDDDCLSVLITHSGSSQENLTTLAKTVAKATSVRPHQKMRFIWIHLENDGGVTLEKAYPWVSDNFPSPWKVHALKSQTKSNTVDYSSLGWATCLVMLLEHSLQPAKGSKETNSDEWSSFGFASIDMRQNEAFQYLESRTFVEALARENERTELDEVYFRCRKALKEAVSGGALSYRKAFEQVAILPNLDKYANAHQDFSAFSARQAMTAFRDDLTGPEGVIDDIDKKVKSIVFEIKEKIDEELDDSESLQERLTLVESLLGHVSSSHTQGKPFRRTLMLDDCEVDCLADLERLSPSPTVTDTALPRVETLHINRKLVHELADDILNLTRGIEIDRAAGEDTSIYENQLGSKEKDYADCLQTYMDLRSEYTRHRRLKFAALSSNSLDILFEKLAENSKLIVPPSSEVSIELLSKRERRILIGSGLGFAIWLWIAWEWGVVFWAKQLALASSYFAVWLVIVLLRYRRESPESVNHMDRQRIKWRECAEQFFEASVSFAMVNRFQKQFDTVVRKPLIQEAKRLRDTLVLFRDAQKGEELKMTAAFPDIPFVESISSAASISNYFIEIKLDAPPILDNYQSRLIHNPMEFDGVSFLKAYRDNINTLVTDKVKRLAKFSWDELNGNEDDVRKIPFMKEDWPGLTEVMRRCQINVQVLFDECQDLGKNSTQSYTIYSPKVGDGFKELIDKELEAKTEWIESNVACNRLVILNERKIEPLTVPDREKTKMKGNGVDSQDLRVIPKTDLPNDFQRNKWSDLS